MGHAVEPVGEFTLTTPRISVNPWLVLAVLLFGEFVILLDTTIMEVAIPSLISDLHASLDEVLWVLNAYLLIYAFLLITAGRLGDILGPKRLFLIGMAIFTLGSAACMVAPNVKVLIAFRVLQGIGAAILTPQPGVIITLIFPPEKRGAAFGIMGAVIGLAAVTGPTAGGILTSAFSWRAIFFPNIPIGIVAIVVAALISPEVKSHVKPRIDIVGAILVTISLILLMFAVLEGQRFGWGRINSIGSLDIGPIHASLVSIPSLLLLSFIVLAGFILWEAKQEEPLLPLSLFRDRNFSIGNLVVAMVTFGLVGQMVLLLLFLQSVLNLSPLESGIAIVPNALMVMAGAPIGGKLSTKINGKYLLLAGLLLYAGGVFLLGRSAALNDTGLAFTLPLLMTGLGMGLTIAPMATLAMQGVAPSATGAASGFMNTVRQVGAALAAAIVGAVFQIEMAKQLKTQAIQYAPQLFVQYASYYRKAFIDGFSTASTNGLNVGPGQTGVTIPPQVPPTIASQMAALGQVVFTHSFLNAMQFALVVPLGAALAVAAVTLFMQPAKPAEVTTEVPLTPEEREVPVLTPVPAMAAQAIAPVQMSDTVVFAVPQRSTWRLSSERPIRLPSLDVTGSGGRGMYPLKEAFRIGRTSGQDLVLNDPQISRQHAIIFLKGGIASIRDLASANGTFVNGQRLSGEYQLRNGDLITMGSTVLNYRNDLDVARPRLVPVGETSREHLIAKPVMIGRASDSDIVLRDPKVSRHHAEVGIEGGRVVVRDLASLNGTKVNGELAFGMVPLHHGDILAIGNSAFIYKNDAEAA